MWQPPCPVRQVPPVPQLLPTVAQVGRQMNAPPFTEEQTCPCGQKPLVQLCPGASALMHQASGAPGYSSMHASVAPQAGATLPQLCVMVHRG